MALTDGHIFSAAQAVRPLKIKVLTIGKSTEPGFNLLADTYTSKLQRFCAFQLQQLKSNPKNTSDTKAQAEAESGSLLRCISPKDWVALLDENGREITSPQLAGLIADAGNNSSSTLIFCVGGPYGHGTEIRSRANVTLRLSSMVLNHQIALIVLLEQIYRAWTILKGEKYHH